MADREYKGLPSMRPGPGRPRRWLTLALSSGEMQWVAAYHPSRACAIVRLKAMNDNARGALPGTGGARWQGAGIHGWRTQRWRYFGDATPVLLLLDPWRDVLPILEAAESDPAPPPPGRVRWVFFRPQDVPHLVMGSFAPGLTCYPLLSLAGFTSWLGAACRGPDIRWDTVRPNG
jgi:hypothetical protein